MHAVWRCSLLAPYLAILLYSSVWLLLPWRPRDADPYMPLLTVGLVYATAACQLIVAHCCKDRFSPYQPLPGVLLLPTFARAGLWAAGFGHSVAAENTISALCLLIAAAAFLRYAVGVVGDVAAVLGVHIFSLRTPSSLPSVDATAAAVPDAAPLASLQTA